MSLHRDLARALVLAGLLAAPALAWSSSDPAPASTGLALFQPFGLSARLPFRLFSDRQGLPQNSVFDFALDRRGYLWAGTQDGLARFDGRSWHEIPLPSAITAREVRALLSASDGTLWVGTSGSGAARLVEDGWQVVGERMGLVGRRVMAFLETTTPQGSEIWIGTERGLNVYSPKDGRMRPVALEEPSTVVTCLLEVPSAGRAGPALLIGTSRGVLRLERKDGGPPAERIEPVPGLAGPVRALLSLPQERGERLLFVATDTGVSVRREDGTVSRAADVGLSQVPVNSLLRVPGAHGGTAVWAGTFGNGIAIWEQGRWSLYDGRLGLPDNYIWKLFGVPGPGEELHAVWLGTSTRGAALTRLGKWVALDTSTGLPANTVLGLFDATRDPAAEEYWIGTVGGLCRIRNRALTVFGTRDGLPGHVMYAMARTRVFGGDSLIAGTNRGLAQFNGTTWQAFVTGVPPAARVGPVFAIAVEPLPNDRERLWVGGHSGVARFDGKVWEEIPIPGVERPIVQSLICERLGTGDSLILAGTNQGLFEWVGDAFRPFCYPHEAGFEVMAAKLTRAPWNGSDLLWLCPRGKGLWAVELGGPEPRRLEYTTSTRPALPNNVGNHITTDPQGRLYVQTNRGVARLSAALGDAVSADPHRPFTVEAYLEEDGLPANEGNRASAMCDHQGRIWVGTVGGVGLFDPSRESADLPVKPLAIERTLVRGAPRRFLSNTLLRHDENDLSFEFTLLSFFRLDETRYRTRLVNFEKEPTGWEPVSRRDFTNLGPGDYVFEVWGRDHAGRVSGPERLPFRVARAPWATPWAYLVYAAAAVGTGYGLFRLRVRALELRTQVLEIRVADRTAELAKKTEEALEAEREAREASRRLVEAQERMEELEKGTAQALHDIPAWGRRMAEDIRLAISAESIALYAVKEQGLVLLSSPDGPGEPLPPAFASPDLEAVRGAARARIPILADNRRILPVVGMTGELSGAVVIAGMGGGFGETERRLVESFAGQLGAALELQRLRSELATAAGRHALQKKELLDRGIDLLHVCEACGRCFDHRLVTCPDEGTRLLSRGLLPYRILGRYRLTRVLGEGGMGTVYEAHDERLDREVAIKVIQRESFRDEALRQRFDLEAWAMTRIHHPSVIAVYDTGEAPDGSAFLVMERLFGRDLGRILIERGPGSPAEVAALLRQASSAVSAAHRAGVIHRDIKPENLFIGEEPSGFHVTVLDFGLAKSMTLDAGLTQSGFIVGTPSYMAPEQLRGLPPDARDDLYSLAAVAYEALTGRRVVEAEGFGPICAEVLSGTPPPLSRFLSDVPEVVVKAFRDALQKSRAHRPESLVAWASSLASGLESMPKRSGAWSSGPSVP